MFKFSPRSQMGIAGDTGPQGPVGPTGSIGPTGGRIVFAPNYNQVQGGVTGTSSAPFTLVRCTPITTTGYPVRVAAFGDFNNASGAGWVRLQLQRNGTGIGPIVNAEGSSASENSP